MEQLERTRRWYERFKRINEGTEHTQCTEYYQDEAYAFFINCYHLKDWIKNDPDARVSADNVESFINNNETLRLCADICNGLKHLRVKSPRSLKGPEFGRRHFELTLTEPNRGHPPEIVVKYEIDTKDGPIDAFDLATKCLQAWEEFIKMNIGSSCAPH